MIRNPEFEINGYTGKLAYYQGSLFLLCMPISILFIVIILESKQMEKAGPKINLAEYCIIVFSSIVVIPRPQFSGMRKAMN